MPVGWTRWGRHRTPRAHSPRTPASAVGTATTDESARTAPGSESSSAAASSRRPAPAGEVGRCQAARAVHAPWRVSGVVDEEPQEIGRARDRGRGEGVPAEGPARTRHAADGRQDQGRALLDAGRARRGAGAGARPVRRHGQPRHRGVVARRGMGRLRRAERGRRRGGARQPPPHQVRRRRPRSPDAGADLPAAGGAREPGRPAVRSGDPRPAVRGPGDRPDAGAGRHLAAGTIRHGRGHRAFTAGDAAGAHRTADSAAGTLPRRQLLRDLRSGRGRRRGAIDGQGRGRDGGR